MQTPERGGFTTGFGFILAAAGSAIGLGNIWGFPYVCAESGGGAFVLLYLVCVLIIGVPVMYTELCIGRASQKSPVGAFKKLAPGSSWFAVGGLGVFTGFFILSFYSLVAGWTMGYLYKAVTGQFAAGITLAETEATFAAFKNSYWQPVLWTAIFFLISILVVRGGVTRGIERVCKVLMPIFFLLLIGLVIRGVTLPGAAEGVKFLFDWDLSEIKLKVVGNALGQAMFSLSLGMGAMITYGSYLSKKENLAKVGLSVAFFDTFIALLAGLMIFPALFAAGGAPGDKREEALVFEVLPTIFDKLPAGDLFAVAFFVLLVIAAVTSSISLLEVITSYVVDERGWSREKGVWILGGSCFLISIPCALYPPFMGFLVKVFWKCSLPFGATLMLIFVGWKWKLKNAYAEATAEGGSFPGMKIWGFLVRWVCPVLALIILFISLKENFL